MLFGFPSSCRCFSRERHSDQSHGPNLRHWSADLLQPGKLITDYSQVLGDLKTPEEESESYLMAHSGVLLEKTYAM